MEKTGIICVQDVCLVNVEYDVRGTLIRYIRSCQPLQQCAYVQKDHCTKDKCCSEAPDKCFCRPGNKLQHLIATCVSYVEVNVMLLVFWDIQLCDRRVAVPDCCQ